MNKETEIGPLPEMTNEDNHSSGDTIEETTIQEFPDMVQEAINPEEQKKKEKVIITEEECENFYGCILEAAHGMIATGKGKPHRDIPAERRKAQGKVLHRLIEKYNISLPAEFDLIIMGASVIADWQFMGAGGQSEDIEPEPVKMSQEIIPEMGGVVTNDSTANACLNTQAVQESKRIEEVKLNDKENNNSHT